MSRAMTKVKEESSLAEQNLKTMGASLDGVGTGFETAEGAMSLFGAESEALEETMKKTQEGHEGHLQKIGRKVHSVIEERLLKLEFLVDEDSFG